MCYNTVEHLYYTNNKETKVQKIADQNSSKHI